jgi:hypothetical protein
VPDGFFGWSAEQQWRWLRGSGQQVTLDQWKAAVQQASATLRQRQSSQANQSNQGRDGRWSGQQRSNDHGPAHQGRHRR